MLTYDEVCEYFLLHSCKILTSKEDVGDLIDATKSKSIHHIRVSYIASCHHLNNVTITNFMKRTTGRVCTSCLRAKVAREASERNNNHQSFECITVEKVTKLLSSWWEVKRTNEGCLADLHIKPLHNLNDEWLAIQIKTTRHCSHGMYSFRDLDKPYDNMLILCHCLDDDLFWMFNHEDINLATLNVSKKSKYNSYIVDRENINSYLISKYDEGLKFKSDILMCPINVFQQREQRFKIQREQLFPHVKFITPDIHYGKSDFLVQGTRFQEKVAGKKRNCDNVYLVGFSINNGRSSGKRKYQCYQEGDNDYYWIHLDDHDEFFVFPEHVLVEKGLVAKRDDLEGRYRRKSLHINLKVIDWKVVYKYNCDNLEKLNNILRIRNEMT